MARAPITHRLAPIAALFSALLLAGAASAGTFEETFTASYRLDPGATVSVRNTNGRLEVVLGSGPDVRLEATKRVRARSASRAERALEETEIEVDESASRLAVETIVPRRSGGFLGWIFGHQSVEVSYRIEVPAGIDVELRTINGHVDVESVGGNLQVRTTNGRIMIEAVEGDVIARTTNGSVRAELSPRSTSAVVELRSTNGGIAVDLPEDWGGEVEASTVNGSVRSDLPVTIRSSSRRRLEGRIGAGAGRLDARTVNGGIRIGSV